ncbi:class I adenylate-forming enzyme family protein [Allokutzneria oryzae]|uniref:Class I adenylate-forming enzyme family protein n=1 Tax=Allokutzneria oryzae TaxID=1378989 RepID=A0ABV5ZS57_9PSEU
MTAKFFATDSVQTFPEFERNTLRVVEVLRRKGMRPGDRVLLKAGNSLAYVGALFALMHLGASIVLVDPQERAEETRFLARQAGAAWCLVDDDAPLPDDEDRVYLYELFVAALGEDTPEPAEGARLDFTAWGERRDGLIMYSSGSTGTPKGIVKSGGKFLRNLVRNAEHMGHRGGDVLLPLLPFSHQYGLSMVLIAWLADCSLVIAPYKRIDRALRLAGQAGVTVVDATPATYRSILNMVGRRPALREDLRSARMLCAGAAPLDPTLVERSVATFGLPLLDSYGSTEMGNVAFATTDNAVGTGQPMDGIEVRVINDDGAEVVPGEVGELIVRTPDLMEGYLGLDGGLVPIAPEGGWFRTNDLGFLDDDGNVFVIGRKFAVQRMGYVLYPEIIEHKLAAAGCSVKIIATPDERRGAQLVFFVEDEQERDARHWRGVLSAVLPPFEHPNQVRVLDRFPLNRNGKPDRKELERMALAAEPVGAPA